MNITVRKAGPDDMGSVKAVMAAATAQLRTIYRPSPAALARARSAQDVHWLIAMAGNDVVGALRYVIRSDSLHLGLGVRPDFQRKGVARDLIEALAKEAAILGRPMLSLETVKETGNVAIFSRLGFTVVGEEPDQWGESVTGASLVNVRMERDL